MVLEEYVELLRSDWVFQTRLTKYLMDKEQRRPPVYPMSLALTPMAVLGKY